MEVSQFQYIQGSGPIIAIANHSSHELRPELEVICLLDEATRLREEDPFTDEWATVVPSSLIPCCSRFEVDLNRPREEAFYLNPEDAWGLNIWEEKPSPEAIERSLEYYDDYYDLLKFRLSNLERKYGRFVVLDLHSYNHRRKGPKADPEDPEKNPEVNVGTGTMDRKRWAPLVDRFMKDLKEFDFMGRSLDVRENVKFVGRQLPQFVHTNFPKTGCALALEFKKFFMNEWTGRPDKKQIRAIGEAIRSTLPGIKAQLKQL